MIDGASDGSAGPPRRVARLVGVYAADGGVRGELAYAIGSLLGRVHCGLCDVTHGRVRRKASWDAFADRLGVPVELVHLNERDADLRALTEGIAPCVVAYDDARHGQVILGPEEIDRCAGDVDTFEHALMDALEQRSMTLRR